MIAINDVKHIAELARIGFSEKEIRSFQNELSLILGYVEKLKKVDVSNTKPTYHPLEIKNIMRQDEPSRQKYKLLSGFLKVKSIFQ